MHCDTMIFGKVEIAEEFESELEAREEDYYYDAHAYYRNVFGGVEPVSWKVLAKSIGETRWRFCKIRKENNNGRSYSDHKRNV